jgi:hypothetical protein
MAWRFFLLFCNSVPPFFVYSVESLILSFLPPPLTPCGGGFFMAKGFLAIQDRGMAGEGGKTTIQQLSRLKPKNDKPDSKGLFALPARSAMKATTPLRHGQTNNAQDLAGKQNSPA